MKVLQRTSENPVQLVLLVMGILGVVAASACAPLTPTPAVTPTGGPTGQPTGQPTQNFRATEAVIISHVFATMTASAPTAVRVVSTPIVAATSPAKGAATATKPKVTTKATNTPAPIAPKPTVDPYLAQIPKGKGGILVISYVGTTANFTIPGAGCPGDGCQVDPNGRRLIVVDPGPYNISVQIIGPPGGSWTDTVNVIANDYVTYSLVNRQ